MDVRKEIIRPGTYTYETPSGGFERMTVTADTIKHLHDQGKAMLAANLAIPVPLEHQKDAKPQTPDEKAAKQLLNNAGFVKDYEIKDDQLIGILDIPDADIRKKLPTTIRSVSPWINSFTDGSGKKWDGVISHVALTTRPRIAKQANFETIALALNSVKQDRILIPADVKDAGVSLSSAGLLTKKGIPKFPIAFSLLTGVKLAGDLIPDDDEDDDDEPGEENDGKKAKPKDSGDPPNKFGGDNTSDAGEPEAAGDVSFEELIPHLLEMLGVKVSAGSKDEEFLKMLVRDLLREVKALGKEAEAKDDTSVLGNPGDKAGGKPPGPVVQESPPMYMSLTKEQVDAIADPKEKQIASAFFSQQSELNALRKNRLDEAGVVRQARIDRLLKKIPPAAKPKLVAEVAKDGAKLSLANDGVVVDPLATYLDLLESSIPDLPSLLVNGVKFAQEESQPTDGTLTNEQLDKIADGLVPKPKDQQAA